jgi:tetratricopeptide (TPR) repeat protein
MESEKEQSWQHYRDAMSSSVKLAQHDDNETALQLLDRAIARAISENQNQWVLTLSHHAAVIAHHFAVKPGDVADLSRVKHYYNQSLTFNPENPRALEGLADVAREQGEHDVAKQYAARCYKVLVEGDDWLKKERLESLLAKWLGVFPPNSR